MKINPNIIVYDNFRKDYQKINAWTRYESFPIEDLETLSDLDKYAVIEIIYNGTHGDSSKYDSIKNTFDSFMQTYLNSINTKYKLLFQIGEIGLKSKIRSYKGIFGKLEAPLEEEFDVGNGYSIIEGVINLNKENQTLVKSYLFDREKCFLIVTEENMYSKCFLTEVYNSIIDKPSYIVNYIKACNHYCDNNNIIIRESGDGGDQEFGWQLFINKENANRIIKEIENILDTL